MLKRSSVLGTSCLEIVCNSKGALRNPPGSVILGDLPGNMVAARHPAKIVKSNAVVSSPDCETA